MRAAPRESDLIEQVARSCRLMGRERLTRGASGHVSARIPGTDRILIKSKGPDEEAMEFTTENDIILINLAGEVLETRPGLDPPNETSMHLAVYRARPEVGSVIHTHPDWVVVLTAARKPLRPIFAAYRPPAMRLAVAGIPIYPRSVTIINDELGRHFMETMADNQACLLLGHGMTVAGATVHEATRISLDVHELARMNYLACAAGDPKPVPEEDIREYQQRHETDGGRRQRLRPQESWRLWRER